MEEIEIQTAPLEPVVSPLEQLSSASCSASVASRCSAHEQPGEESSTQGENVVQASEQGEENVPPAAAQSFDNSSCSNCSRREDLKRMSRLTTESGLGNSLGAVSGGTTDYSGQTSAAMAVFCLSATSEKSSSNDMDLVLGKEKHESPPIDHCTSDLDHLLCSSHSSDSSLPVQSPRASVPLAVSAIRHYPVENISANLSSVPPIATHSPNVDIPTKRQHPDISRSSPPSGVPSSLSSKPPAARLLSAIARWTKAAHSPRETRGALQQNKQSQQKSQPASSNISSPLTESGNSSVSLPAGGPNASPQDHKKSTPRLDVPVHKMGNCVRREHGESSSDGPAKPPRFGLDSNKRDWIIENYKGSKTALKLEDAEMKHNVLIRDNNLLTLEVAGKVNNVTIDNCKDVAVIVNSVVSQIEFIRCNKCSLQILGTVASISLDNCASVTFYVSVESKRIQVVTSQISDVNMHVPESKENPDEWVEVPIPAQFVHSLKPGTNQLVSTVSELYR